MTKISQYASMTTLAAADLIDVSKFIGPAYETRSLSYANMLTNLASDLPINDTRYMTMMVH